MKFNFKNKSITMNIVDTHDDIEIGLKPKKFQKKQHQQQVLLQKFLQALYF